MDIHPCVEETVLWEKTVGTVKGSPYGSFYLLFIQLCRTLPLNNFHSCIRPPWWPGRCWQICASGLRPLEPKHGSDDLLACEPVLSSSTQHCHFCFPFQHGSLYISYVTKSREKRTDDQDAFLCTVSLGSGMYSCAGLSSSPSWSLCTALCTEQAEDLHKPPNVCAKTGKRWLKSYIISEEYAN